EDVSDVSDFEDEEEEIECELVEPEPSQKLAPKHPMEDASAPSTKEGDLSEEQIRRMDKSLQDVPDEDFEDEDEELEPELISEPKEPNRKPNIKFEEPQKTKPTITSENPSPESTVNGPKKPEPPGRKGTNLNNSPDKAAPQRHTPRELYNAPEDGESDVEEEPELISAPNDDKPSPSIKFKDPESKPKSPPKRPLRVKPGEGDVDPDVDADLPWPNGKPGAKKTAPSTKPKPEEPEDEPEEVEEEPDLVSGPGDKPKPDVKFKDPKDEPKKPKKKPLKVKPAEGDTDPEVDADLPLPKGKPSPKKTAPSKKPKPKEPDDEPEDVEEEPELVSGPEDKPKPDVKFKDPKSEPKKPKKKPLKVKPADGDTDPDIDATIPLNPDEPDEEPETDGTFTLPRKPAEDEVFFFSDLLMLAPRINRTFRKTLEIEFTMLKNYELQKPEKPKWVPPPRTPPEPYEFPPEEKKLCDVLKEEKIPPTKRYAKKPKELDVYIPFVIPWEQWPCIQSQEGMGAFGKPRDAYTKIEHGSKPLVQGDLHSETINPLLSQDTGASSKGMMPFGAYRRNVSSVIDNHDFDTSKLKLSEGIIPKQMQGSIPPQNGETVMGSMRNQKTNVKYLDYMSDRCAPESHAFISKHFAPTSTEMAGSSIIDRRRNVIANVQGYGKNLGKFDTASEAIVPLLFHTQDIYQKSGADFGSFRPVVAESEGGYHMTYDEEKLCKMVVPYQVRSLVYSATTVFVHNLRSL
ncbi:unnamed protein product, partial [Anisakis simplex]|uniref:Titin n=1 Tax=Anisakis simplex TaxID=6269 RepID=A0A0M3JZL4_ANISI